MTDPSSHAPIAGPFQKYLFSSACYVQVGGCYEQLCRHLADGDGYAGKEITARLAALWHDQALGQAALPALMPPGIAGLLAVQPGSNFIVGLHQSLLEIGRNTTDALLHQLAAAGKPPPSFDTFFEQWVTGCAEAYDSYVRSEPFVQAFGGAVNLWIRQGR